MILCVVVVVVVPAAGDPVSLPQDVHSNTIFTSPTSEHFLSSNGPSSDTKTHNTYFSNSDTYLPRTHLNPSFSDTNQQSTILHSFSDTHQHNIHLHHSEIDQHNIHIHSSSDTNQHSTYSDSSNTYRHSTHLLDTHKDTITYMSDDILQNLPVVAIAERYDSEGRLTPNKYHVTVSGSREEEIRGRADSVCFKVNSRFYKGKRCVGIYDALAITTLAVVAKISLLILKEAFCPPTVVEVTNNFIVTETLTVSVAAGRAIAAKMGRKGGGSETTATTTTVTSIRTTTVVEPETITTSTVYEPKAFFCKNLAYFL